MFSKKYLPPVYLIVAMLLMMTLAFLLPVYHVIPPVWALLGLAPVAAGILLNLLADRFMHQAQTTVKPFERSSVLAVGGVYGISRNPMYLGFVSILIGIAVLLGAVSPWLVVIGFVVLMQHIFIRVEERMLADEFGTLWQGYCKHTRRWL